MPIKYEINRKCDLDQVGDPLDSKDYAIGMPLSEFYYAYFDHFTVFFLYFFHWKHSFQDSPYKTPISKALLTLQQRGTIKELIDKWWESKDVDANGNEIDCQADEKEKKDTDDLDIKELGGIFIVLAVGVLLSVFVGFLEFIWSVRRTSIDERVRNLSLFS